MVALRIAAVGVAALVLAGVAAADGDPASDVLYEQNVFLPSPAPSGTAASALRRATQAAYARGFRVKVAVIESRTDLGAASSLFGDPTRYGQFLGTELGLFYIGPLLIVMPQGFGIYDGGRSTAAERRVLDSLKADGSSADALTGSATGAIEQMTAAGALRSKDIKPPLLFALPARARHGSTAKLQYQVIDDSGKAQETVRISFHGKLLAVKRTRMTPTNALATESFAWLVPKAFAHHTLRFCIVAVDPARNASRPACAPLTIT